MIACAGMVALRPFFGGPPRSPRDRPGDPAWGLALGPVLLAALGLACGLFPQPVEAWLVAPMVRAVAGTAMPEHLALWHGPGLPLILSLVTFVLGGLLYLLLDRIRDALAAAEPKLPRTEGWYDAALGATNGLALRVTEAVQNGRMTSYLRRTFVLMAALIWAALLIGRGDWPAPSVSVELIDWAIVLIITASIAVVLRTPSRLTAITALGGVGAGIAIIFVIYGAIDVAMTQLFVEVLVVVFLAIAMVRLPPTGEMPFRPRDALIAGGLGLGVTLALMSVLAIPLDRELTTYFEQTSAPVAFGRNIVNVILVDFRGFDTLGEIAVVVIAGVAAVAALNAGRRAPP
jgi:multicomponent Na+:H+ antiporter subunit A